MSDDLRFRTPLYTVAEAARVIGVPATTLATWTKGYERARPVGRPVVGQAVVTAFPATGAAPNIPFVGLAEGLAGSSLTRFGVDPVETESFTYRELLDRRELIKSRLRNRV